jgi:hypothetical protein
VFFKLEDAIIFMSNFAVEKINFSIMKTKKIQILKEVVRDVLIVLGLAMVVVAPIAFVLFMMWVQQIVCG